MKKPIRCGVRSGNTFRFGRICSTYGAIEKNRELLMKSITYTKIPENFNHGKIMSLYSDIINDGEISRKMPESKKSNEMTWDLTELEMSLNKHKRWLLPEFLVEAVDAMSGTIIQDQGKTVECELSFSEQYTLSMLGKYPRGGYVPDCTGYHDSGAKRAHVKPKRLYGMLYGMKQAARGNNEELIEKLRTAKMQRRLIKRNHDRGTQRYTKKQSWREIWENIYEEDLEEQHRTFKTLTPRVEVQYGISHRRSLMAHNDCSDKGHFSRYPWSFLFSHPQKSLKKVKPYLIKHSTRSGLRKDNRREITLQCNELDYQVYQLKGRSVFINEYHSYNAEQSILSGSDSEESSEGSEDEKCRNINCDLSDFVTKKAGRTQRDRKAEERGSNALKKQQHAENFSRTSRLSLLRYGKGEVVYEEKPFDFLKYSTSAQQHTINIDTCKKESVSVFYQSDITSVHLAEYKTAPSVIDSQSNFEENNKKSFIKINKLSSELSDFILPAEFLNSSKSFYLNLSKESTTAENLVRDYGAKYKEGFCLPRKFFIDMTERIVCDSFVMVNKDGEIENEMDKDNVTGRTVVLFEEIHLIDIELLLFRISFADLPPDLEPLEEKILENFTELNNTMNINDLIKNLQIRITSMIFEIRENHSVVKSVADMVDVSISRVSRQSFSFIRQVLQPDQSLHSYSRHLALHHASQSHFYREQTSTDQQNISTVACLNTVNTENEYCEICLSSTNKFWSEDSNTCSIPATLNSDISQGLALISCLHNFCMQCWRRYLLQQISERSLCIKCPGSSCNVELSRVVMSAILPRSYMNKFDEYCAETLIEKNRKEWSFCNNVRCNRVTHISGTTDDNSYCSPIYSQCSCRSQWCIDCHSAPHWPSTCQQSNFYRKLFLRRGMLKPIETLTIEYRTCPQCRCPIEKDFGCSMIRCRKCKERFCWLCGKSLQDHYNGCSYMWRDLKVVKFYEFDYIEELEVVYAKTIHHRCKRLHWAPLNMKKWIFLRFEQILKLTADESRMSRRPRKRSALLRANYLENYNFLQKIISGKEDEISEISSSAEELALTLWSAALLYVDARCALEYSSAKLLSAVKFNPTTRHKLMKHLNHTITTFSLFTDELEQDLLGRWEQSNVRSVREHIDDLNSRIERGKQLIKQLSARANRFDRLLTQALTNESH